MVKVTKVATTLWQRFRGAAALRPRARGAQENFHGEAVNLRNIPGRPQQECGFNWFNQQKHEFNQ